MTRKDSRILAVVVLLFLAAMPLYSQIDSKLFNQMRWRLIGPFRGGRVLAVAGVPGNPRVYYFGAAAGGVWKTTDGGESWVPIFDDQPVSSIGALAVAPTNPDIVYVGTGEACIRNDISYGDGIYKSTDGGKTWKNVGLKDTRHIGRVLVHPKNPDVVYVAALGHAYGPNPERGIFRSTDGGRTWQKILYKDEKTGGIDISFAPGNPQVLFAALWEASRSPYSMTSGGPGSGLYKSTDGGDSWQRIEGHGLPEGTLGRIGVSVSPADPNRVYAMIETAKENALYRSDDGGENWKMVNNHPRWVRPWYYNHVLADPRSPDTVYVLDLAAYRSTDGGKNFSDLRAQHGDHHALWIDPTDPDRIIDGNDGGATISVNGGKSWTAQDNQPTGQFYHAATDSRWPYRVYGSQQDNTSVSIRSRSDLGAIGERDWHPVGGGECGYIIPDRRDPDIVYAGAQNGQFTRWDGRTGQAQNISPQGDTQRSHPAADGQHRLQWTAPMAVSPHDPAVLYLGGEVLFKTANGGRSWSVISPDLTRNDKSKQQSSGGLTPDDSSAEYYDTIFTVAESPVQKDLIWVGTDDGYVQLTRDGGKNWSNVTPKQMPAWSLVSLLDPSPFHAGTAYIAVDRHRFDDLRPYIYKTSDYGKTWTQITSGIPDGAYVHAVRQDPSRKGLLYAGTETGVFVSFDDGGSWQRLRLNLPTVPVYDLVVHDDDLVIATHGRAFWILDDLAPLRQANPQLAAEDVHVYKPSTAYRMRTGRLIGTGGNVGQNPPNGAVIDYYLKAKPQQLSLEILDESGQVVRKFTNAQKPENEENQFFGAAPPRQLPSEAGMNRFVWDLRHQPIEDVPGLFTLELRPGGPLVLPGNYQVRVTADGKSAAAPLKVSLDPRVKVNLTDIRKQHDFVMQARDRVLQTHELIHRIRGLRAQLDGVRKRISPASQREIADAVGGLQQQLDRVESDLIQVKATTREGSLVFPVMLNAKFAYLIGAAESADAAPTQQLYLALEQLTTQLRAIETRWDKMQKDQVTALDEMLRKANLPTLSAAQRRERIVGQGH